MNKTTSIIPKTSQSNQNNSRVTQKNVFAETQFCNIENWHEVL
jgi:hypothetical protein